MATLHETNRALLSTLSKQLYDWDASAVQRTLAQICAPDALFRCAHPFGDVTGPQAFYDKVLAPLQAAWPDLERREWIVMAGDDTHGADWVGCGGHYVGTFAGPLLDIPPTGHLVHMRFHEFYRIEDNRIVEMQAILDLPEVMMQAGAWPMVPSLGAEIYIPGPASDDGLRRSPRDVAQSTASRDLVTEMLAFMKRHPRSGGPEVMEMIRFWHAKMNWYGPAGIGTCRGIRGFRNWHQIPFLAAMPDRGQYPDDVTHHFFGDGPYVGVTGWPNMVQTLTHDGWMGLVPSGQKITMRSLDFWRLERGKIRENWVLVDLLDLYRQLGVDVFQRLREFNKARVSGRVPFPVGEQ